MRKSLVLALLAAALACNPALASQKKKAENKKKEETGASCKAPAVGRCAACSITCPPGEAAICASGQPMADVCHIQPTCRCERR